MRSPFRLGVGRIRSRLQRNTRADARQWAERLHSEGMINRPIGFKHQAVYKWKPMYNCAESPARQDSRGDNGRMTERKSPNQRHEGNGRKFLRKRPERFLFQAWRPLVPQGFAQQTMRSHATADGTTTLQRSDTKYCLGLLRSCMMRFSSRICSQRLPKAWIGLQYDGEHLRANSIYSVLTLGHF